MAFNLTVSGMSPDDIDLLVAKRLFDVKSEVDQFERDLVARDVPLDLALDARFALRRAISPRLFFQPWQTVRNNFTDHVVKSLSLCVLVLPTDQNEIDAQLWNELRIKVDDLRALLKEEGLPPRVRELVRHHLELIEDAMQSCRVRGVIRLQEALDTASGELQRVEAELQPYANTPPMKRLGDAWRAVKNIGEAAISAEKYAQLAHRAWDLLAGP